MIMEAIPPPAITAYPQGGRSLLLESVPEPRFGTGAVTIRLVGGVLILMEVTGGGFDEEGGLLPFLAHSERGCD